MKTIKDYDLTEKSQNVAWNGTLILTKGRKNYYLNYHSGNSNYTEETKVVPFDYVETVKELSATEALSYFGII